MRELEADQKSSDKVPLTYWASIADGATETTFERTKLVSSATVRRAQQDKGFEYKFAYGIAIPYLPEMLASAKYGCKNCGKPATRILQTPTTHWYEDPPMVQDIQATPMCDNTFCNNKAKSDYMEMVAKFSELQKLLKTKGVDMNVSSADREPAKVCLNCGKMDQADELRKCSRHKRAFFCNRDCQRSAWKRHKKDCRPPESTT